MEELNFQLITLQGPRDPLKPDHIRQWFDLIVAEGKRNTPIANKASLSLSLSLSLSAVSSRCVMTRFSCCFYKEAAVFFFYRSSRRSHSGLR